jgi:hypothetical protein
VTTATLRYAPYAGDLAFAIVTLVLARSVAAEPAPAAGARAKLDPTWRSVADGLSLFRAAILARLGVLVLIALVNVAAISSRDAPSASMASFGAILDLVALIAVVAGAARFAAVPASSGARPAAVAAAVLLAASAAIQVWISLETISLADHAARAQAGEWVGSLSEIMARVERLPYVALASGLVGLAGSVSLLGAGRVVAAHIGEPRLSGRLGGVAILVGAGGTAALVGQLLLASAERLQVEELLVIGAAAFCGAVGLFVAYVSALSELVRALRSRVVDSQGDAGRPAW